MIELKEALIGKNNIKNASRSNKVYCVAVYDDDLDLRHAKEFTHVRSKDHIDVFVGSQDAVIKYADEIDKMETDIGCIKNPELSIQDVVDYLKRNDWLRDCERMCDRCFTAHIDESLIGKHNINNVDTQHRTIWWIISPSDEEVWELSIELKTNNCNSIPYHTTDGVTCFIVPEDKIKNLNLSKFNELVFSKSKKKMTYSEVVKVVTHSDYYSNTTWDKYFNDNLEDWWTNESLIGKSNIKNAGTKDDNDSVPANGLILLTVSTLFVKELKKAGVELLQDKDGGYYILQDLREIQKWQNKIPDLILKRLSDCSLIINSKEYKTKKDIKRAMMENPVHVTFHCTKSFRIPGVK